MAKKALLDVLEKTIGKYVKNLDAESLNVAVWSGTIQLDGLELDVAAVNSELDRQAAEAPNLAIPFRVVSGQFASLQVDVPWAQITSKPVVLRARGLRVSVEPFNRAAAASQDSLETSNNKNNNLRAKKLEETRRKSLEAADEYRQQENAIRKLAEQDLAAQSGSSSSKASSTSTSSSFGARLARRILENLQIEINDVHVSLRGSNGSAGLLLESVQLVSTDQHGQRTFVDRTPGADTFLYKALSVRGLGLYLDEDPGYSTSAKQQQALSSIREDDDSGELLKHSFVLAPLSFDAKLRQADSNVCVDFPKYLLEGRIHTLSAFLSKDQLELAKAFARQVQPPDDVARPLFPEYRPLVPIAAGTAGDWWRYAARCIGRLNGRRLWVELVLAFRKRKRYVPLYKRMAHSADQPQGCPWIVPLSVEERAELDEIEHDRSVSIEGIMMWRNIADAQMEKEREKHDAHNKVSTPKSSIFTSLFGSPAAAKKSAASSDDGDADDTPPVTLTVEEMKELEEVMIDQIADAELSKDSRLVLGSFVLGSLNVNLTSHGQRPLANLEMGTVSSTFDANADGSFTFDFSLSSLCVSDRVTVNSHFPDVLKNQERPGVEDIMNRAFDAHVAKTNLGDLHVVIKLETFETVASPLLLTELKHFATASQASPPGKNSMMARNPLLAQSLSGSVDLFYDTTQGASVPEHILLGAGNEPGDDVQSTPAPVSDLSHALIEAWKSKTETKASWVIDLDLHAPIIVIPENCVSPRANVLIFDLGRLRLTYGTKSETVPKVKDWFAANRRSSDDTALEPILDCGLLSISNLTFMVGKANYWRRLVRKYEASDDVLEEEPFYEPISLSLDFGVESSSKEGVPRVCTFGVIPLIGLNVSLSQVQRILTVASSWLKVWKELSQELPVDEKATTHDQVSSASSHERKHNLMEGVRRGSVFLASQNANTEKPSTLVFAELRLKRLALSVSSEGTGIEAQLVSVVASFSSMSDSSSRGNLSMGWFWVLDRLKSSLPRRQRLVVHSNLPLPAEQFAEHDTYDTIVAEIGRLGAFNDDFSGSTELADIELNQSGQNPFLVVDPLRSKDTAAPESYPVNSILDAKFSSLYLNWNPHAIKAILAALSTIFAVFDTDAGAEVGSLILSSPEQLETIMVGDESSERGAEQSSDQDSVMLIKASMDSLEISLNSARDDLPLFLIEVSQTNLSMATSPTDSRLSLTLDDLKLATPEMGRTAPMYRTILGLAPGREESLLTVHYCDGPGSTERLSFESLKAEEYEACARIELSPMRLVYIQAQVLALVEYGTEGILGALTAQAASSAAAAAIEIAASTAGKKIFRVSATGFEVILPQAAYLVNHLSLASGTMLVDYTAFPDPGGGQASLELSNVMLSDSAGTKMIAEPVQTAVNVSMPPDTVGTKEDQTMQVKLELSEARFLLVKCQYAQTLSTLDDNIGESDLCIRDHRFGQEDVGEKEPNEDDDVQLIQNLTHAGAEVVDNPRRIHLDMQIRTLSFLLCGTDEDDPIIQVEAVESSIILDMIADEGRMTTDVTLKDLVCTDKRLKAIGRHNLPLVYQAGAQRAAEGSQHVFRIAYESNQDQSSKIDMQVGSPHFVFVPDAVSDTLTFFSVDRAQPQQEATKVSSCDSPTENKTQDVVEVEATSHMDEIEASVVQTTIRPSSSTVYNVKTKRCCFIMVDLGSNALLPPTDRRFSMSASVVPVSETVVFEGVFESGVQINSDSDSGQVISIDAEFHGDAMEVYTADGRDLRNPMQILEPAQVSFYFKSTVLENVSTKDLRAVALTPLDVCISMRNVALVNAILQSISECFDEESALSEQSQTLPEELSANETEHIELLASMLESDEPDQSVQSAGISSVEGNAPSVHDERMSKDGTQSTGTTTLSVKITLPETKVTVINDLQGLDEALLRTNLRNVMLGVQVREGECISQDSIHFTGFDFNLHMLVVADYFDVPSSLWRPLLLEPWEVSTKVSRGPSNRFKMSRPSTTMDVESFPCYMRFSEQFLMNLASANRMWQVYTTATSTAHDTKASSSRKSLRKSLVASAARNLITSLPYAIENHAGVDLEFLVSSDDAERQTCASGSLEYFRFDPPRGAGTGGKRLYGQDLSFEKSVTLCIGGSSQKVSDIDSQIGCARQVLELSGHVLILSVQKEGKSVVLHLSSGVDLHNRSFLPFSVALFDDNDKNVKVIGTCHKQRSASAFMDKEGRSPSSSPQLGVPVDLLKSFQAQWQSSGSSKLSFVVTPQIESMPGGWKLEGLADISLKRNMFGDVGALLVKHFEITCRPTSQGPGVKPPAVPLDPFVVQACVIVELVGGGCPVIDIIFHPRAVVQNSIPIPISIRTPMPHTYSNCHPQIDSRKEVVHTLEAGESMEIFTPGPSIAITTKCSDNPVAGASTDWMTGWVDLPLVPEFRLFEPLKCEFPFVRRTADPLSLTGAHSSEFFIAEGGASLSEALLESSSAQSVPNGASDGSGIEVSSVNTQEEWRKFIVTVCNYAVDHTGDILFEQVDQPSKSSYRRSMTEMETGRRSVVPSHHVSVPFGAYGSQQHHIGRISLLPGSNVQLRLLHLTMEGDEGMRKSSAFRIEDVSISEGGVDSTPLKWEDGTQSGYFAYRILLNSYQSEIHVIPEYVVFNGSKTHRVRVKQPGGYEMSIDPGKIAPLETHASETATITVEFIELGARTAPIRVDSLGLRIAVARSSNGTPIGSIAVQTVVGARDSRLVIKLGDMKFGALEAPATNQANPNIFSKDFLRFRVQWSELRITLDEGRPIAEKNQAFIESAMDRIREAASPTSSSKTGMFPGETTSRETWVEARGRISSGEPDDGESGSETLGAAVCTILLYRFTVDWQRVFKDEESSQQRSTRDALLSPERSQLSIIVHNVQLRDETPNSPYPIVFDSTSEISFFDLCIRCKGPLDSELVKVDLFDLNLAHANGASEQIVVNTYEDFVWKLLDLANRIFLAAGALTGIDLELQWDDEQDGYVVSFRDKKASFIEEGSYTPPKSDQLFDISVARVSPFTMLVSFTRTPQASRYKVVKGVRGANIMNYFTKRLKFKVEKAELKFARYEARNIKGPPDRLLELLTTVYLSRMKLKFVTIMTAVSFQDWKSLASRDGGDDEFVGGDILRVTGNLAGNTVNYVLKKAGRGIGKGVSTVTSTIGNRIENATGAVGARAVGAGVNSLVSGVGDGVGSTISGVGTGAGQLLQGVGQGAGQVFGGVTGGATMIGKGIGRGITTGDGQAVVSGLTQGATSVGLGVGQGVESVVTGTAEGVFSVGEGFFSGVKSVGKGIGGAFLGKKPKKTNK